MLLQVEDLSAKIESLLKRDVTPCFVNQEDLDWDTDLEVDGLPFLILFFEIMSLQDALLLERAAGILSQLEIHSDNLPPSSRHIHDVSARYCL